MGRQLEPRDPPRVSPDSQKAGFSSPSLSLKIKGLFQGVTDILRFRVNFTDTRWDHPWWFVRTMLVIATLAGLNTQWQVGYLNWMTVVIATVPPIALYFLAPRKVLLAMAMLNFLQAIGTWCLIAVGMAYGLPYVIREVLGLSWMLYCAAGYIHIFLTAIRTKKVDRH